MSKLKKILYADFITREEDLAEKIMRYFKIKENGKKHFFDDTDPDFPPEHKFFDLPISKLEKFLAKNYLPEGSYYLMNSKVNQQLYYDQNTKKITPSNSRILAFEE